MSTPETLADEFDEPQILDREVIHRGYVWDIVSERFQYGNGEITREFVDHTGAVAVIAMDDEERILLIRQYRHPVRMRDWELPAGLLDAAGEAPLAAAQRELAEEADLTAGRWHTLIDFFTTPGGNNESIRIYVARDIAEAPETFARTEEEADIQRRWVPLDDAVDAVQRGQLHNPSAVIGILSLATARARNWRDLKAADEPWPTRPPGPWGNQA